MFNYGCTLRDRHIQNISQQTNAQENFIHDILDKHMDHLNLLMYICINIYVIVVLSHLHKGLMSPQFQYA
jgi:hypothetical protein